MTIKSGFIELLQCQSNQSICMVCHEQRYVQHIIVQLQIIQREPHTELHLIREQFLVLTTARITAAKMITMQSPSMLFTPNTPITIPEQTRLSIPVTLLNTVSAMLCPRLRKAGGTLVSVTLRMVGSRIPIPELMRPDPAKTITGDTAQYAKR